MPIGYLITAALAAWCTLMALAPPRRPRPLGVVAFIYGLALNELPFLVFYYLVLSTLLAAAQSNIDSPAGWIGMALSILTVAGLVLVAVRALRAGPVLDRALAEGLGTGGLGTGGLGTGVLGTGVLGTGVLGTGVLGTGVLGTGRLPLARIVFAPFLMRRRDVERIANISYGDAGVRNRLDVYRQRAHPAGQAGSPVFVHLHGGMLMRGRKNREALPLLYRLASQGWVCISANYRLRPSAHFPDHLIDAKKVIAWVRAHGTEFGADPDVLILAGTSSGGQLAALAAFTQNDPRYQPGFEHADTSVSAVVYLSGYYGSDEQSPWSPLAYDATDAPPFFVVHGDQDTVVPVQDARLFVGRLRKTSPNPVIYAELPGAQHSFERFHSLRFDTLVNAVETFATWVRNSVVDARHS